MKRYESVDAYVDSLDKWKDEIVRLRQILNATQLQECVKWGAPAYTYQGKIVIGLAAFKEHFGIWFHQGALLKDKNGVLVNSQEGKTKALRQWRMQSAKEIKPAVIKSYVKESIGNIEKGAEIKPDRNKPISIPIELAQALKKNKKAQAMFAGLTPGKQREFAEHISDAKRPETKQNRIEKILPMIISGVGLNDKYKNC
jgi:uncharacterized protein YdeI (YjbR/CyaY-like superfamily)